MAKNKFLSFLFFFIITPAVAVDCVQVKLLAPTDPTWPTEPILSFDSNGWYRNTNCQGEPRLDSSTIFCPCSYGMTGYAPNECVTPPTAACGDNLPKGVPTNGDLPFAGFVDPTDPAQTKVFAYMSNTIVPLSNFIDYLQSGTNCGYAGTCTPTFVAVWESGGCANSANAVEFLSGEFCKIAKCEVGYYLDNNPFEIQYGNTLPNSCKPCTAGDMCQDGIGISDCAAGYYCPGPGLNCTSAPPLASGAAKAAAGTCKCPTGATSNIGGDVINNCYINQNTKINNVNLPMNVTAWFNGGI